ncbi:MAG: citrate synthase, partial [Anaerolineales bacterium]|nr:citrate synthase [Anaerolineales bacterium]
MSKGLAGVTVADTSRSSVNGTEGILIYHGYDILDLGENASFEEVAYLLWNDKFPTAAELAAFKKELVANRTIPAELLETMKGLPKGGHPVAVLRTMVSAMALVDDDAENIELTAARQ